MWRNAVMRLFSVPQNGDEIEVHGGIGVYETAGQYQFYADQIRPLGEGELYQEFLELKLKLEAEGLFDPAAKRLIPETPQRIGIVTSPTGAALQDILDTIKRRFTIADVIIAPTAVQGSEAPPGIVNALKLLNEMVEPDVILLARGGGSIEDLWAFNDERVARAVAASEAPVICGVGHETDFTITDFTADLRAPTPTAAAELATPHRAELSAILDELALRMNQVISTRLNTSRIEIINQINLLASRSPRGRIRSGRQRLDELSKRTRLAMSHTLQLNRERLASKEMQLISLNPLEILKRGYAVLSLPDQTIVRTIQQVKPEDRMNVRLFDGQFDVKVDNRIEPDEEQ
jgi:exodeoxyribonuclease VII large subunit